MREFIALRDAKVIPLSAHTGHGLDSLRTTLAAALSQHSMSSSKHPLRIGTPDAVGLEAPEVEEGGAEAVLAGSQAEVPAAVGRAGDDGEEPDVEVVEADAPQGAATATVLDYTSSAKSGRVLVSVSSPLLLLWHAYCTCRLFLETLGSCRVFRVLGYLIHLSSCV